MKNKIEVYSAEEGDQVIREELLRIQRGEEPEQEEPSRYVISTTKPTSDFQTFIGIQDNTIKVGKKTSDTFRE